MKKYVLLTVLLASCSPIKNSSVSPIHDGTENSGRMQMFFESTSSGNAKATAVSSDGEVFNGNVIARKSRVSGYASGSTTGYYKDKKGRSKPKTIATTTDHYSAEEYTSDAEGVFMGSKGNSMSCSFTLSRPSIGIAGGGVGECEISDGRIVPVSLKDENYKF